MAVAGNREELILGGDECRCDTEIGVSAVVVLRGWRDTLVGHPGKVSWGTVVGYSGGALLTLASPKWSPKRAFRTTRVSHESVRQESHSPIKGTQYIGRQEWSIRVSQKSVLQECRARASVVIARVTFHYTQECATKKCPRRVAYKSVPEECPAKVSRKSVPQECTTRVFRKSVPQEWPTRACHKSPQERPISFLQECCARVSRKTIT